MRSIVSHITEVESIDPQVMGVFPKTRSFAPKRV